MKNIYGDKATIDRARKAPAGDKGVYINWQAIEELPDEYEAIVTEVKYDPANPKASFSDVGNGTWMPNPDTMYKIAEACGISGVDNSASLPIIEEVDINPMLLKPLDAQPTIRRMIVGRSVTKQSTVMQEDGTLRTSSPCNSEYNAWERCCELWSKEELDSEGYKTLQNGKYKYFDKDRYGDFYTKGQYQYEAKYNNQLKRHAHFQGEMKFAHAKAETKAYEKTIRELANLVTGYKTEDLKSGSLIFAKIRRSRELLKLETAARLQAMSRGIEAPKAEVLLFPTMPAEPEPEQEPDPFAEDILPEPVKKSKREEFIDTLTYYLDNQMVTSGLVEGMSGVLNWLKNHTDAEADMEKWQAAVSRLRKVEEGIPETGRLTHTLY